MLKLSRPCLFLFSILLLSSAILAQRGIEFGAYVQPQTHWILNTQDMNAGETMKYKLPYSMAIGINAGYNFTDMLGVRTGLGYTTIGQDYLNTTTDPDTSSAIDLKYLRIPFFLKFSSGTNSKLGFLAMGGPQLGYLTAAEYIIEDDKPEDVSLNYASIELSVSGAAGILVNMDDGSTLNFLIRGEYSLNNIEESMQGRDPSRNLSVGLYIGYNYNLYFQ